MMLSASITRGYRKTPVAILFIITGSAIATGLVQK